MVARNQKNMLTCTALFWLLFLKLLTNIPDFYYHKGTKHALSAVK